MVTGETHDVVDGEEVAFVLELGNELQFRLDKFARLLGRAIRPAPARALLGQHSQPAGRRLPGRYQLVRVLIAQLLEIEGAALGNAQRLAQQYGRIEFAQLLVWPQMPFAIGKQTESGLGHGDVMAHGGEGVLQGTPAAGMHMHIASRHGRYIQFACQLLQAFQTLRIVRPAMQSDG